MNAQESLIPKHGGYRKLKSFQIAQLVYDITLRFCNRYIDKRSRTHDQMVQAARSGVQNIAEGSQMAYERRNRDLDPQLVWRGKDEQDWSDLVVQAPPLYIQEKCIPRC
jgi:hypothetical protein